MSNSEFYIKRVRINGLFGQKNIDWQLNKDVNILGGINGSGKSTVINCIFLYLACGKKRFSEIFKICNEISVDIYDSEGGEMTITCSHPYTETANKDDLYYTNISFLSSAEHQIVSNDTIKGIGNDKIKTTLDLSLYKEINKRNELVTNSTLQGGDKLKFILESNNLLFETINDFFKDTNKQLSKESSTFDILIKDKIISCYNLSTGEKQLLLILLTVFNTNGRPSVILMDEPDLGIHIDWKKKLIKSIRNLNPKAQLILSTHSPSMLEGGWFDKVTEMNQTVI